MMNRILIALMLVPFSLMLRAQTYTVYSTIGNTRVVDGKRSMLLLPRRQVSRNTKLYIGAESAVTLIDEKNSRMYPFSTEGTYTVGQLVDNAKTRAKNISKQYMSYLIKQLFSDGSQQMIHPDAYMQVTATSYRSASSDSMLLCRIAQDVITTGDNTVEQQLCLPERKLTSDMDVHFELVSCDTGFALENNVKGNTGSYVRVYNNTEEVLYVNVLDIDEQGHKYLVLPVDEAATCAHLLVPPMSTVSFKSDPFIFSEEPMKETFILFATQEPVDFSILMNPIPRHVGKSMKSGLYRNTYQVQ